MKRIKKTIIGVILTLLCTGCTIDYKLEITKDTVKENIAVNDTIMTDRTKQNIYDEYNLWVPVYINMTDTPSEYDVDVKIEGEEYHTKTIKELNNGYYYTYKFDYPIKQYQNAFVLNQAYENANIYVANDYITINSGKVNLLCNYSYFESMKVSITVDEEVYKVRKNNAFGINGNTYIWNLNKNNCNNSEIILVLDKISSDDKNSTEEQSGIIGSSENKNNKKSELSMYIVYGILILLILIVYLIFRKIKNKNTNSIDD